MTTVGAYYSPLGPGRYRSNPHAEGAWAQDHQHMAPVAGLLTEAIEAASDRADLLTSRIAFDILGVITAGDLEVTAQVVRPGRTIELVEAEMVIAGRPVVRALAWRLATSDTADFAESGIEPMPGPDSGQPWDGTAEWDGGYIRSVQFRVLPGRRPGHARAWLTTDVDLVEGAATSDLGKFVGLIDTANGIAARVDPREILFPNTDLTVHLFRRPAGRWLGLDTTVSLGPDGVGMTASVLHDVHGPVGRAAQTLTVRRRVTG